MCPVHRTVDKVLKKNLTGNSLSNQQRWFGCSFQKPRTLMILIWTTDKKERQHTKTSRQSLKLKPEDFKWFKTGFSKIVPVLIQFAVRDMTITQSITFLIFYSSPKNVCTMPHNSMFVDHIPHFGRIAILRAQQLLILPQTDYLRTWLQLHLPMAGLQVTIQ